MGNEKEIARSVHDLQSRGKDYALVQLPGFLEWSENKSKNGGNEAAIDHMLAMSMFLLPEEVISISADEFDEIYEDIVAYIE